MARRLFVAVVALAGATAPVAAAESALRIPDASPIYLLAVVAVAVGAGTWPAVLTALAAFLTYDLLFVQPHFTLVVADPGEWLNLVLLLVVGVAIGRLTALVGERAEDAARRARENQALFRVSRTLATAGAVREALPGLLASLVSETGMDRIWVTAGAGPTGTLLADTDPAQPRPGATIETVLHRKPGDQAARWIRTDHQRRALLSASPWRASSWPPSCVERRSGVRLEGRPTPLATRSEWPRVRGSARSTRDAIAGT